MKVKICGITNLADAEAAVTYGADALGFIFAKASPRFLPKEEVKKLIAALPPFITTVGVFTEGDRKEIEEAIDLCGLDLIQFHGRFPQELVGAFSERAIAVVSIREGNDMLNPGALEEAHSSQGSHPLSVRATLLDSFNEEMAGGIGIPFNWAIAALAKKWGKIILAGGLTPDNVKKAIEIAAPYAVDVCSGVEKEKGKKDHVKLKRFIEIAKGQS